MFILFIGMNHHLHLFGCDLVCSETAEPYLSGSYFICHNHKSKETENCQAVTLPSMKSQLAPFESNTRVTYLFFSFQKRL